MDRPESELNALEIVSILRYSGDKGCWPQVILDYIKYLETETTVSRLELEELRGED